MNIKEIIVNLSRHNFHDRIIFFKNMDRPYSPVKCEIR